MINIRKLAALDIVFHGVKLILAEFILAVIVCGGVGVISFVNYFHSATRAIFTLVESLFFLWTTLNYLILLLYAIRIVWAKSAEREVAYELEHQDVYGRKYTVQSVILFLPLIVPILAIYQELQQRRPHDQS